MEHIHRLEDLSTVAILRKIGNIKDNMHAKQSTYASLTLILLFAGQLHSMVLNHVAAQKHAQLRVAQLARIERWRIEQQLQQVNAQVQRAEKLDAQLEALTQAKITGQSDRRPRWQAIDKIGRLRAAIDTEALAADRQQLEARLRNIGPDILHQYRIERLEQELRLISIPIIAAKAAAPQSNSRLARLGRWFATSRPARFVCWIKNKLWPPSTPFDHYEVRPNQVPHFQHAEQLPDIASTNYERLVRLKRATRDQEAQRLKNLRFAGARKAITAAAACRLAIAGLSAYRHHTFLPSRWGLCKWSIVTTASIAFAGWLGQRLYQRWHHTKPLEQLETEYIEQMRNTRLINEAVAAQCYDRFVRQTGIGIDKQYGWARKEADKHFEGLRLPAVG